MKNENANTETMKTKRAGSRTKIIVSLVAVFAATAVSAAACGRHGHMSPEMMQRAVNNRVEDLADEIDATDEQRAAMESTAQSILKDALAMKAQHKECKKEMLSILSEPTVDRETLKEHIQSKIDRLEDFVLGALDRVIDVYETLDAEQRQIIVDKLANHMDKH